MSKKHLAAMTIKDKIEELLNDEPKTLFRIMQLIPGIEDGIPNEEDDILVNQLHQAKFVVVKEIHAQVTGGCSGHIDLSKVQNIEQDPIEHRE